MSAQKTNRECLTLLEWVLAAGVEVKRRACYIQQRLVVPNYDKGYMSLRGEPRATGKKVIHTSASRDPYRDGLRLADVDKKHRAAWEAGEDPTEWRAAIQRGEESA